MKSVITRGLVLAILGLSLGGTAPAWAGTQLFDYPDTVSGTPTLNINSQLFLGIYERGSSTANRGLRTTAP